LCLKNNQFLKSVIMVELFFSALFRLNYICDNTLIFWIWSAYFTSKSKCRWTANKFKITKYLCPHFVDRIICYSIRDVKFEYLHCLFSLLIPHNHHVLNHRIWFMIKSGAKYCACNELGVIFSPTSFVQ